MSNFEDFHNTIEHACANFHKGLRKLTHCSKFGSIFATSAFAKGKRLMKSLILS